MMRMIRGLMIALLLLFWGMIPFAAAEKLEVIRQTGVFNICANPEALPYTANDGQLRGFQLELHDELAKLLGWRGTVTWVNNRIGARRMGCGGFMGRVLVADKLPVRNSLNSEPYMGSGFVIVLPASSPTDFESLETLLREPPFRNGGRMGIYVGAWIGGIIEKQGVKTYPYLRAVEIIEGVRSGKVVGGVVAREDVAWYLKGNPNAVSVFEIYKVDPNFRWNVGMGMRNADRPLIETINDALGKLNANHTLEKILRKYGIEYQPPFPEERS